MQRPALPAPSRPYTWTTITALRSCSLKMQMIQESANSIRPVMIKAIKSEAGLKKKKEKRRREEREREREERKRERRERKERGEEGERRGRRGGRGTQLQPRLDQFPWKVPSQSRHPGFRSTNLDKKRRVRSGYWQLQSFAHVENSASCANAEVLEPKPARGAISSLICFFVLHKTPEHVHLSRLSKTKKEGGGRQGPDLPRQAPLARASFLLKSCHEDGSWTQSK